MNVVMVAAEMVPFAKVGGLADVVGALPRALSTVGCDVSVILPFHRAIARDRYAMEPFADAGAIPTLVGGSRELFKVWRVDPSVAGVPVYLLENPAYFDRAGLYDDPKTGRAWPDNAARFTAFSQAAIDLLWRIGATEGILHIHDHHTGLIPAYLRDSGIDWRFRDLRIVFTIHNLGYQGVEPAAALEAAGFERGRMAPMGPFEFHGKVNFMKAGMWHSDAITTVSPTYANEICDDPAQGFGLDGVLRERRDRLFGILNGIDVEEWNPETDPHIAAHYTAKDVSGKRECKRALLERSDLDPDLDAPLVGMITRLTEQKGLDLLAQALPGILALGCRLVVLGTGEKQYHEMLAEAAQDYPGRVGVHLKFDNALAHQIEAGSDLFLMPSRYEPCGLNQMYSLRYGTLPVVRKTGGLADTVRDADVDAPGNGYVFEELSGDALLDAVTRAVKAYRDPKAWSRLMRTAMAEDFSWSASARRYLQVYRTVRQR